MPLILGAGLGVWEGRVILVGISVFVIDILVLVTVGDGKTTFALLQEVCSMKSKKHNKNTQPLGKMRNPSESLFMIFLPIIHFSNLSSPA